jgi:uncharacterized protein with von Willebrand factor type A (vWA) domain
MNLKQIWQTATTTIGLITIAGLAAANKDAGMAVGATSAASASAALLGMQIFVRANPN